MDEVRLIAERGPERFEIVEGSGEGFYIYRWEGDVSTHDYLQDDLNNARHCALEQWGISLDAWRPPRPGEHTFFEKDSPPPNSAEAKM